MIQIRPITSEDSFHRIKQAAKEDGHGLLQPTHVILKDGEFVGAFSVSLPALSWWMDTRCGPRDSLAAFQGMDTILAERGIPMCLTPCERSSPYYEIMQRPEFGFDPCPGDWDLFIKRI